MATVADHWPLSRRDGHAPCVHCGKQLARLDDGCLRAHRWQSCPGKTEESRMVAQHSHPEHTPRTNP